MDQDEGRGEGQTPSSGGNGAVDAEHHRGAAHAVEAPDAAAEPGAKQVTRGRYLPPWAWYAVAGVGVLVVLAFALVPRFTGKDPYESLGEEASPARSIADLLDAEMSCTAGEIGDEHSVLACSQQTPEQVLIVFLQSNRQGQVASYTVETQPLGAAPDTGRAITVADKIAAVATPGADFSGCSHGYGSEYFCFESLASWHSTEVPPIESTGEKARLPTVEGLGARLNELGGWECEYGICTNGETSMTTAQSLTGLGLQFAAPVNVEHVRQATAALLDETGETDELQEWVQTIDGSVSITVADGFVVGYLPQVGESGLVVIDEVAGVLPDTA